MRATVVTELSGPQGVEIRDVACPVAGADQVLIDVHYAAVVFPDVLQTRGEYQMRPALPFVLGWEVSGTVRADSCGFRAGDRVVAMPVTGGFAETVAVEANMVFPLPDGVGLDKAAALPLNYLTVDFALKRRGRLRPGETVLVHGAAGGVGTAACQLASARGARVIAVVSSDAKAAVARAAGAHDTVSVDGFRESVHALTDGAGVDVVVDPVGGDRFTDSLRCLAVEGRLLVLGFTGRAIPTVRVNRLLLTNTSILGVASEEFWTGRPTLARERWHHLTPLIRSSRIDPPIDSIHPLEQVRTALTILDERRALGRVLLQIREQKWR